MESTTHPLSEPEQVILCEQLLNSNAANYTSVGVSDLAGFAGVPLDKANTHFRSANDWIDSCYCLLAERYRQMTNRVPGYEEYSTGEKLVNFTLTSMDMMRDYQHFVDGTFHHFILNRFTASAFEKDVQRLFEDFVKQDGRVAYAQQILLISPFYTLAAREYLHLLGYWISHPNSEEEIMALCEKSARLLNELLYNGILDNAADLGRFLYQNNFLSVTTPFVIVRRLLRW
ncbi:hypothetical protein QA596_12465 [Balneolales bacterium ANBcel1]|nr:hypothetical protein [Balneolales bacterium ANBcel1]